MNGNLISKKLGTSWECQNAEPHNCSLRQCEIKRKEYRRRSHELRKEKDNSENLARYHSKYKRDPVWMKRRRETWKRFAQKQSIEWVRERSKRYRKPYSQLSESTRSKIRKAYTSWAKRHWKDRVEYARKYRRKNPAFGFRSKIAEARRSGDIGKLAQECFDAIIRANEANSSR